MGGLDGLAEVLVGKTLEQSMMEVLEEEELASLQRRRGDVFAISFFGFKVCFKLCSLLCSLRRAVSRHQEDFEKRRNAELLEVPKPPGILMVGLRIPLRVPLRILLRMLWRS